MGRQVKNDEKKLALHYCLFSKPDIYEVLQKRKIKILFQYFEQNDILRNMDVIY